MAWWRGRWWVMAVAGLAVAVQPIRGRAASLPLVVPELAYADLADLTESAPLVLLATVRKVAMVERQRATDVKPGTTRIYVEAQPVAMLDGTLPPNPGKPPLVRYLVDVPSDAKGRVADLKKHAVLLFARPNPVVADEIQLVAADAQLVWDAPLEARVRAVIGQIHAADAPPPVNGVREAIYVPGALVGEGETQIFLATAGGTPASLSVIHAHGEAPRWSVSFSEVVDPTGKPPVAGTLAWYRLACFLPAKLPEGANVSETPADSDRADADYALVRERLGECGRKRG